LRTGMCSLPPSGASVRLRIERRIRARPGPVARSSQPHLGEGGTSRARGTRVTRQGRCRGGHLCAAGTMLGRRESLESRAGIARDSPAAEGGPLLSCDGELCGCPQALESSPDSVRWGRGQPRTWGGAKQRPGRGVEEGLDIRERETALWRRGGLAALARGGARQQWARAVASDCSGVGYPAPASRWSASALVHRFLSLNLPLPLPKSRILR
jgi:hypothetical protein